MASGSERALRRARAMLRDFDKAGRAALSLVERVPTLARRALKPRTEHETIEAERNKAKR